MLGGWTAALLLKAVLMDPGAAGAASALTINFIARVQPGTTLTVVTRRLGGGRSQTHWQAELLTEAGEQLAIATAVLTERRASDGFCEANMPDALAPETLAPSGPPEPFAANLDMRVAAGTALFGQKTSRTLTWERERSDAPLDVLQLVMLSDIGAPRIFYFSEGPRPSATMTLSIYVLATPEDLASVGDGFVLGDMIGTRGSDSTFGVKKDMWSQSGKLLATSEQLCWFR